MHKAVPAFTIQHHISHTLLIKFNYWIISRTAETNVSRPRPCKTSSAKTKTAEFWSWDYKDCI